MNTTMTAKNLFGGLSQQAFLDKYWEKKPLFIKQAFPDISPPFSAEELAGLCCDTDAPARMVIEKGEKPWQVISAPLREDDFINTPETHWTVLVNDLERYYPEHLALLDNFRFIPEWRKDDLMVSYAVEGGNVGPHIDEYGVFLIQAMGERRWQVDPAADPNHIIHDIELKLLTDFNPQREWIMSPGDMLYLPPHLAHYGVALSACMTYSIGYRSPSQQELIESWLDTLFKEKKTGSRYNDAGRKIQTRAGEINATDILGLKKHLLKALTENDSLFSDWLGKYLTRKKNPDLEEFLIDDHLDNNTDYFRHPSSEIAWIEHPEHIAVFINGEASNWSKETKEAIQMICSSYTYPNQMLEPALPNKNFRKLFGYLLEHQIIHKSDGGYTDEYTDTA